MSAILIVAGENSGDKHAAELVRQFKNIRPSVDFYGIGGEHMAAQGVSLLYSVEDLSVVGIFEVLTHLKRINSIYQHIRKEISEDPPVAALLVDSPDFNLRLAKHLKKASIPVLYYISPTVWAWRKRRLNAIQRSVEKMLLIFPFEEKIYAERGIPSAYVGHPLKERVKISLTKTEFFDRYSLDPQKRLIAILPGSRKSEIKYHMPVLAEAVKKLGQEFDAQFVLPLAENLSEAFVKPYLGDSSKDVHILSGDRYEGMAFSDIALASCGTANLEAALLGTPIVAFYRISPLTYHMGIKFMKIKDFSIVNILAGKKIIPELIQKNFTCKNILIEARKILAQVQVQTAIKAEYERIRRILGDKIASENAARELDRLVHKNSDLFKEET